MLEQMSPWEYQEIRQVLGHGSGFDSPGWREVRRLTPMLGQAFHALREEAGLIARRRSTCTGASTRSCTSSPRRSMEWDERVTMWRIRHYKVVARIIGDSVVGTQGTPVEVLGRLIHQTLLPGAVGGPQRADRALAGAVT